MADEKKDEKIIKKKMPKIIYTSEEEDWLVANVMEYRGIIENKKTDGATNRDKEQAWEQITKAFNVAPPGRERAVTSLCEKYQKIKQTLKDRAYYFSKDAKQTGGGPPKKELPPLSEPMKKLAELIIPSTIGLAATAGDSDGTIANQLALQSASRKLASGLIEAEVFDKTSVDDGSYYLGDADINILFSDDMNALADPTDKQCSSDDALASAEIPTNQQKPAEEMLSDEGAAVDRTWERVNPSKLRKPVNSLLNNRRCNTKTEAINKIPKMSEQKQQHLSKKQKIEIEILECERERYKFERERAEFDRDRAALDRERSAIDEEYHRVRLAALKRGHYLEIASIHNTPPNPMKNVSFPTTAAKKEYFCD